MLVTVFDDRSLPKSGPQMEHVKAAFGFVILAPPALLLERVAGDEWSVRLWSLLGVVLFGWAFITSLQTKYAWMRTMQIAPLAAVSISVCPLQDWAFSVPYAQTQAYLDFTPVAPIDALNQAPVQAKGRSVMLDLYADWYVTCKGFEKYTFSNLQARQALGNTVLSQADVTTNNAQGIALLEHLQVLGLPTISFFGAEGKEHPEVRVTGFMDAMTFNARLRDHQS